jgi:hypothetical protein
LKNPPARKRISAGTSDSFGTQIISPTKIYLEFYSLRVPSF